MSKRYVIQVQDVFDATGEPSWQNVQHPAGGSWLTRSYQTAVRDAARLVNDGETRELRVAVSQPVYEVVPMSDSTEWIKNAAAALVASYESDDSDYDDDDEDEDDEDDDELTETLEAQVGQVPDEGDAPVFETDGTDPDAPKLI